MAIRDATPSDAYRIAVIHVESWRTAYGGIMPDSILDGLSIEKRHQSWSEQLAGEQRQTIVAEHDGEVVGWATFGPARDADAAGLAEVYGIYLHPTHYHRGFGTALWKECTRRFSAQGFTEVVVWVLSANQAARHFYEAMGAHPEPGIEKLFTREGANLPELRYRCPCP